MTVGVGGPRISTRTPAGRKTLMKNRRTERARILAERRRDRRIFRAVASWVRSLFNTRHKS